MISITSNFALWVAKVILLLYWKILAQPPGWFFWAIDSKGCAWFTESPLFCWNTGCIIIYVINSADTIFPLKLPLSAHNSFSFGISSVYCNVLISSNSCVTLLQTSLFWFILWISILSISQMHVSESYQVSLEDGTTWRPDSSHLGPLTLQQEIYQFQSL